MGLCWGTAERRVIRLARRGRNRRLRERGRVQELCNSVRTLVGINILAGNHIRVASEVSRCGYRASGPWRTASEREREAILHRKNPLGAPSTNDGIERARGTVGDPLAFAHRQFPNPAGV